jgi:hypothetical protein
MQAYQDLIDKYSLLADSHENLVELLLAKYIGEGNENGHDMRSGAREYGIRGSNNYYKLHSYCRKCGWETCEIDVSYENKKYAVNIDTVKQKCKYAEMRICK